jgi:predicted TIM-barrel fold metal-dependent hydrolase
MKKHHILAAMLAVLTAAAMTFAGCANTNLTADTTQAESPKLIDFEAHFATQEWADFVAARTEADGVPYTKDGKVITVDNEYKKLGDISVYKVFPDILDTNMDTRIAAMDEAGIETQVLSDSNGIEVLTNSADAIKYARIHNDAVKKAIDDYPGRFLGSCALPICDIDASIAELERCSEMGFVAWHTYSNYGPNGEIDDAKYLPLIKKAAELGMYIYIHPAFPQDERMLKYGDVFSGPGYGFTADTMAAVIGLVINGTFDEVPELKVMLGHFGETLPSLLERMDNRFGENYPAAASDVTIKNKQSFSHYFENNIWVTNSGSTQKSTYDMVKTEMGMERIFFGSDYPYESITAMAAGTLSLEDTPEGKTALASGNAERFLEVLGK